jgi:hypothetical protein
VLGLRWRPSEFEEVASTSRVTGLIRPEQRPVPIAAKRIERTPISDVIRHDANKLTGGSYPSVARLAGGLKSPFSKSSRQRSTAPGLHSKRTFAKARKIRRVVGKQTTTSYSMTRRSTSRLLKKSVALAVEA